MAGCARISETIFSRVGSAMEIAPTPETFTQS